MAAAPQTAGTGKGLIGWIDQRFPLTKLWKDHVAERSEERRVGKEC